MKKRFTLSIPSAKINSSVFVCESFPKIDAILSQSNLPPGSSVVLFFDQRLEKIPAIRRFVSEFSHVLPVRAGEALKNMDQVKRNFLKLQKWSECNSREVVFVALGGGSVGDFVGFLASIWKRGVPFIQIPSTWLSAIDSAHGGKTALNLNKTKNQIGTFCFPRATFLIKPLLFCQPPQRLREARGEFLKMAIIAGGSLWTKISKIGNFDSEKLWQLLPDLVAAKMKIVKKDPFESKGLRHQLNLGHTIGHVLEAQHGLPHGEAVSLGLGFSLQWSKQKNPALADSIEKTLLKNQNHKPVSRLPIKVWRQFLSQDKKRTGKESIRFVFIKNIGRIVIEKVSIEDVLSELARQGWSR